MSVETVKVGLGNRSYDIVIGDDVIESAGSLLTPHLRRPFAVIVADETVNAAHGERLRRALSSTGVKHETIALPPGEARRVYRS